MSYVNLNPTKEEVGLLMEGKTNYVYTHWSIEVKEGEYTMINSRIYRIIKVKKMGTVHNRVDLGFMGMYGDEE